MKKSTFHFFNGFFVVAAGVISLSAIITTFGVLAAPPPPAPLTPNITNISAAVSTTGPYVQQNSTVWTSGSMKALGYAGLNEQGVSIKASLIASPGIPSGGKPSSTPTSVLQYAFVSKISDFSDAPLTFSFKNKQLKDASGAPLTWSNDSFGTINLTPEMQGKWLTIYGFIRNSDGVGSAPGLPQQIDDAAVLVFSVPAKLPGITQAVAVAPDTSSTKPAAVAPIKVEPVMDGKVYWAPKNITFPAKLDQVLGYFRITSTSLKPIELQKISLEVLTNGVFNNSVALVRVPTQNPPPDFTILGKGNPTDPSATSTIGLGFVNNKKIDTTGKTSLFDSTTVFPMPKNLVIAPQSSMLVAVTADGIMNISPVSGGTSNFNFKVDGIAWREQGSKVDAVMDKSLVMDFFEGSGFQTVPVKLFVAATSPSGASSVGSEQVIAKYVITVSKSIGQQDANFGGVYLRINSNSLFANAGSLIKVYKTENLMPDNLLGQASAVYALNVSGKKQNDGVYVFFSKPLTVGAESNQILTITINSVGATSNTTVQADIRGLGLSDGLEDGMILWDTTYALAAKQLVY